MPSEYTPRLGLELQETGEKLNIWGEDLNRVIELTEEAIAGVAAISLTGNKTLSNTLNMPNEARKAALLFTDGGLSAIPVVTIPPVEKLYYVENRGLTYAVTMTAGGTTATIPAGRKVMVLCTGTDLSAFDPIAQIQAIADDAEDARDLAQRWAEASNSPDGTTSKSAKTWAGQAATSATSASTSAGTAATAAGTATTQANRAQGFANGLNMPSVTIADAGALLAVKQDGSGFEPTGSFVIPQLARSSDTTLVSSDKGKLVYYTSGTFTQTLAAAATLGSGWWCYFRNGGTGIITIDPNGSETIEGQATIRLYPRESILVQCTGTAFRTAFRPTKVLIADFFVPSPVTSIDFEAFAADTELKFIHFDVYGIDDGTSLAVHLKKGGVYLDSGYIRQTLVADSSSVSAASTSSATSAVDHTLGSLLKGSILARALNTRVRSQSHKDGRIATTYARHPTSGFIEGLRFAVTAGTISEAQFRIHGER